MSVGDIKGFRRRIKHWARQGHVPRKTSLSVAASILKNRELAARAAKTKAKK